MTMQYVVKGKYLRGSEIVFNKFDNLAGAKDFIENKLLEDEALNIKVIYRIYQFDEMMKEYDPNKANFSIQREFAKKNINVEKDSQGKPNKAGLSPTPFNVALRPPGSQQKWLINKDEKKR